MFFLHRILEFFESRALDRGISLSIGFGIMYYLFQLFTEVFRPYQQLLIAGLVNEGFEFMTALGVFGVLGFLAA
jgi:NSS family neurotransmitter:Na+ symporter